jgi:hypothetical protein
MSARRLRVRREEREKRKAPVDNPWKVLCALNGASLIEKSMQFYESERERKKSWVMHMVAIAVFSAGENVKLFRESRVALIFRSEMTLTEIIHLNLHVLYFKLFVKFKIYKKIPFKLIKCRDSFCCIAIFVQEQMKFLYLNSWIKHASYLSLILWLNPIVVMFSTETDREKNVKCFCRNNK